MGLKESLAFLCLAVCVGLASAEDSRDLQGEFDFIYHETHNLLLTIHNDSCYFSPIPERAKAMMPDERRFYIEGNVAEEIISQDASKLTRSSLGAMRHIYRDLEAQHLCEGKHVFQLDVFPPEKMECDFEVRHHSDPLCFLTQDTTDDFDWTRTNGTTPTARTGPMADHTRGLNASHPGHYLFIESSEPRETNETARLISEVISNPGNSPFCLRFSYNMHGEDMGSLNVLVSTVSTLGQMTPAVTTTTVWTRSGKQGEDWKDAEVDLSPAGDFQLIFEGVMGPSFLNDIAVDDVIILRHACHPPVTCDFEAWSEPLCQFQQSTNDTFDWSIGRGPTLTSDTGPPADHTYSTGGLALGHYLYIETSEPRLPKDVARLVMDVEATADKSERCLRFFYHMYGEGTGELNVYVNAQGSALAPVWSRQGDQGDQWQEALVTVPITTNFQLMFEGFVGPDFKPTGDIAIDDISIGLGACVQPTTTTTTTTTAATTTQAATTTTTTHRPVTHTNRPTTTTTTTTTHRPVTHTQRPTTTTTTTTTTHRPEVVTTHGPIHQQATSAPSGAHNIIDVAHGKTTKQSSTFGSHTAKLAVDNNDNSCAATREGQQPQWWEVDLGDVYNIHQIRLAIAGHHSMSHFIVQVATDHEGGPFVTCYSGHNMHAGSNWRVSCNHVMEGRYVRLFNTGTSAITLCDFKVYAERQPVQVTTTATPEPNVRLVGGTNTSGRVEAKIGGDWVTLCDSGFNHQVAQVVCGMLGFDRHQANRLRAGYYADNHDIPMVTDRLNCRGNEDDLMSCNFNHVTSNHQCTAASVACGAYCNRNGFTHHDGSQWMSFEGHKCQCHDGNVLCIYSG